jgi:c-di-GMP-binding flagellar brake protein YcgR
MESVLAVSAPKQLTRFTLRLNYRLTPAGDADINLYLWPRRSKVAIIDISAGGVKFAHPRGWEFKLGAPLKLAVESGGEAMLFDAEVVRANERLGSSFSAMEHTAVRFVRTPPEERRKLVRVIQDLARRELARRSGLADEDRP